MDKAQLLFNKNSFLEKELALKDRELEIEASLERVREKATAMRASEELNELIATVFVELTKLDLVLTRCVIMIYDTSRNGFHWWMANSETPSVPMNFFVKNTDLPFFNAYIKGWQEQTMKWTFELEGENKIRVDDFLFTKTELSLLPDFVIRGMRAPEKVFLNASFNNFGDLTLASLEPLTDEHFNIMLRFAKVFDLTYTRFNDLQKAEAQAREAEIELALERVRARTMAMQHSDELQEVVHTVLERLKELNVEFYTAIIILFTEGSKDIIWWLENKEKQQYSKILIPYANIAYWKDLFAVRENGVNHFSKSYSSKEKDELYHHLFNHTDFKYVPEKQKQFLLEAKSATFSVAIAKNSGIHLTRYSEKAFSENDNNILRRFANVFEQSYTRFLDLQKAEAQAREARIEAALERVRAKAMSMYNSNDVSTATAIMFNELSKLGVENIRCGIGILQANSNLMEVWMATNTKDGHEMKGAGLIDINLHPLWKQFYNTWKNKEETLFYHLKGDDLKAYYKALSGSSDYSASYNTNADLTEHYCYVTCFEDGGIVTFNYHIYTEEQKQILKRFATVFSLTYKRYKDLQSSEANAREAIKQAVLDRIRADIASMRTIDDLDRITPLIWNELTILGVPFIRCGVFIMDDEQQQIHTFLSTPEGKGIAAFHLRYNTPGNIAHVISHWKKKEIYTDHWDEEAFKEFADNLVKQGAMKSSEQYIQTMPAGGFDLHFVPFQQGMLYVGNTTPLNEEKINLLQSIADAFSTAYARYEDFNKLEAAKKQVDNTLTELKQAQQQLVQSEKMASLGELTAGIAHEIQNPLNFVNNFSEVSNELIDEMNNELAKGDIEEAREIASDLKQNLEKINHHGKRADAIVKGMLQHSRQSSGQKELTDINALADEYLRLSYHGLRAKDKNFNTIMETDFDESIGKINIIPQDIGRVLLNLFNNAFYACTERSRSAVNARLNESFGQEQKNGNLISYEPTVKVKTSRNPPLEGREAVTITVTDNGNGIPQKIIDKIFQPFFTTKPTGQGTGLGLSLSYDIVKAHGGEIKVESKEGEGTEFRITFLNA